MLHAPISYHALDSPLGPMIAGATERGLCFLEWTDRGGTETILRRVEKRYQAELIGADTPNAHLRSLTEELQRYFAGELRGFTIPIDVYGSPFQRAVWSQLLKIPYGETRSYQQIAAALDKPDAVRAVGAANGSNYLSIVIPCHRVIGADGSLTGYGGKVWRKKRLLELEAGVTQEIIAA
ncbi:MAG TPA: methylated-DNA--[protein]-cysteine S-methyltransferase [candidate division Zixibacteria bacterium]|nr:methylated-DNA--[protein]-cysteine S-methyltransferase [candidate division Zixibacteria bacterium]